MYRIQVQEIKHVSYKAYLVKLSDYLEEWFPKSHARIRNDGIFIDNWLFKQKLARLEGQAQYCYVED